MYSTIFQGHKMITLIYVYLYVHLPDECLKKIKIKSKIAAESLICKPVRTEQNEGRDGRGKYVSGLTLIKLQ